MKRSIRRRLAGGATVLLAFSLPACGASNEAGGGGEATSAATGAGLTGKLSGAGSSAQAAAVEAWKAAFEGSNPEATVNYDPIGSGGGRTQFISGGVDFAGSDAYLKTDELPKAKARCTGGDVLEFPAYVSPIAVAYKLDGVDNLQLSAPTVAKIFDAKITTWNDPAIAADNPGVTLPATAITPVHRSDESGTTENFTDYLAQAAGDAWPHEADGNWPVSGGEAAKGTTGVVQAIEAGQGTIGYADESQIGELDKAKIKVGDEFVELTADSAARIIDSATRVEGRSDHDVALDLKRDTTQAGTYPIVLTSYAIACTAYPDANQARLVKAWLTYIASAQGQQAAQQAAGSAPLSDTGMANAKKAIDAIQTS